MKVGRLMTSNARTCRPTDSLSQAAEIMWQSDFGCLPVVNESGEAIAMITDRDICMAAFTQGKALSQIAVANAASRTLVTVRDNDTIETAESLMRRHQIRRMPVVDASGKPIGVLSLNDLARHTGPRRAVEVAAFAQTVAAIGEPPAQAAGE